MDEEKNNELAQFIFDKAQKLSENISNELDKLEKKTNNHQVVMSILGYAVSMLVQGQAVSAGNDRMKEVQNFAMYLVQISSLFHEKVEAQA